MTKENNGNSINDLKHPHKINKLIEYSDKKTHLTNYGSQELFNQEVINKINEIITRLENHVYKRNDRP